MELIGRETELRSLREALRDPDVAGVVLRGPSGSGKSVLAQAAVMEFLAQGGLAGSGKYAEGPAQAPFGPIMAGLGELVSRALDQLYDPKAGLESLAEVLGAGAAGLAEVGFRVDGLAPPAAQRLEGLRETAARVTSAALRAVSWIDGFGLPAVLFVDDWTRASPEAQALIRALLMRTSETSLKVLLAERDDRPPDRLASMGGVCLIELGRLGAADQIALLTQVLGAEEQARAVADWLGPDLPGLPFDLVQTAQLLKTSRAGADGRLVAALDLRGLDEIDRTAPVQVVVRKIRRMSADSGRVALAAALWGDVAPLRVLSKALGLSAEPTEAALDVLQSAGVFERNGDELRCGHDRLRAEILASAEPAETQALASCIAESLRAWNWPAHLDVGLRLRLKGGLDCADPERWAEWFACGAAEARAAADPIAAELGEAAWALRGRSSRLPPQVDHAILGQAVLAAADRGDAEALERRGRELIARAGTEDEVANAYELTIAALKRAGDAERGWKFAVEGYSRFGVRVPVKATRAALTRSLLRWNLERLLWREGWQTPTSDGATEPLTRVASITGYLAFERSAAMAALLAIRASMRVRRQARRSAYWFSVDAFICCIAGNFREAARLGELAASAGYAGPYRAASLYWAFYWGLVWGRPQASLLRQCAEIRDIAIAEGDLVTAQAAVRNGFVYGWRNLPSLGEFETKLAQAEHDLEWLGEPKLQAHARATREVVEWLKHGNVLSPPASITALGDPANAVFHPQLSIELACVTGDWARVAELCRKLSRFRGQFDCHPGGVVWRFHETVARLKTGNRARRADLAYLRKAARLNPVDHRAKVLIVEAELHRAARRPHCIRRYALAIEAASAGSSRVEAALAAELAADAAAEFGQLEDARRYAARAQETWRAWGALAKVRPRLSSPVEPAKQPLEAAKAQAAAAERSDRAKSRFLADVAHELRTPLQGMQGLLDLAAEDPRAIDLPAFRDVFASLRTVVDDLTDYGALSSGEAPLVRAPVNLGELAASELSVAAGQVGPNARKRVDIGPEFSSLVETDAARVRQVLRNLLSNAAKYGGGYLGLRLAVERPADEEARVSISVEDDGPGLSEAEQVLVFEPFERGARQGDAKGLGLGLALSRRIAERLGGGIRAENRPEGGARFVFWFDAKILPPQAVEERAAGARPLNVLLAEDVELNRRVAAALLRRQGHRVTEAADGAETLEHLARSRFDLLIMDLAMPRVSGFEVLTKLRAGGGPENATPVIVLTASSSAAILAQAREAGATIVLRKPISAADLKRALGEMFPETGSADAAVDPVFAVEMRALAETARAELGDRIARLLPDIAARSAVESAAEAHRVAGLAAQFGWPEVAEAADALELALIQNGAADEARARLRIAAQSLEVVTATLP